MESTMTFLRKAWYHSKIVSHHTCNTIWVWCKHEFTGERGERKLITTGMILWCIIKGIGIALLVIIMVFKLLLSMGNSDD